MVSKRSEKPICAPSLSLRGFPKVALEIHTRTHTRARTHAHTHAHTHTHTQTHTHTNMRARTQTHTHTHARTNITSHHTLESVWYSWTTILSIKGVTASICPIQAVSRRTGTLKAMSCSRLKLCCLQRRRKCLH